MMQPTATPVIIQQPSRSGSRSSGVHMGMAPSGMSMGMAPSAMPMVPTGGMMLSVMQPMIPPGIL